MQAGKPYGEVNEPENQKYRFEKKKNEKLGVGKLKGDPFTVAWRMAAHCSWRGPTCALAPTRARDKRSPRAPRPCAS